MITIECTKALAKELKISINDPEIQTLDPAVVWHGHLFILNRRKCILLMNNENRYSVFLYGLKKDHFMNFSVLIRNAIMDNFIAEGFEQATITKYLGMFQEVVYTKTHDRKILGQINDMIYMTHEIFEDYYPTETMNIIDLNKQLNRVPMVKMAYLRGVDGMREVLKKSDQ